MALVKVKPTSAGRRALVKVVNPNLHKGRAVRRAHRERRSAARAATTTATSRCGTRAAATSSTTGSSTSGATRTASRRRSSGSNTTRTAARNIALLLYADGERRYIIAPRGVAVGAQLHVGRRGRRSSRATRCRCATSRSARRSTASRCSRARARRSRARPAPPCSCSRAKASTRSCGLRSGEIRKVHVDCRATIGEVGNEEHSLRSIGKAGANRWRGIRPTVRGIAMNPVDHPMAAAPTAAAGHHPVSPWGTPTKGYKTRKNKRTDVHDRPPPPRDEGITTWHVRSRRARSSTAT